MLTVLTKTHKIRMFFFFNLNIFYQIFQGLTSTLNYYLIWFQSPSIDFSISGVFGGVNSVTKSIFDWREYNTSKHAFMYI